MKPALKREDWQRITELFEQVSAMPIPEREAFLDIATQSEPHLKKEVLFLLASVSAGEFLEDSVGMRLAEAFGANQSAADAYAPGKTVGDFQVLALLGSGAFAKVYLARQLSLDREVALKVSANEGSEARTMAHLEHDHIIKVFSEILEPERNLRILCMQYVPGVGLEKVAVELRKKPSTQLSGSSFLDIIDALAPRVTTFNPAAMKDRQSLANADFLEASLWIGARLAEALAYAHERGVLHLDVKPSNILLSLYGRPLLTDFNVSLDARSRKNGEHRNFGGTFNYMPPEQNAVFAAADKQAALARVGARADIYSLGVVLRELISGVPAGTVSSQPVDQKMQPAIEKPEPGVDLCENEVEQLLDRATAPESKRRFSSASDFARAIEGCLELRSISKAMPVSGSLERILAQYPLLSLTLIGAVPQFIASYIGISYNSLRIVSMLTAPQQHWFHQLNITYNPLIYALGTIFWVIAVLRLRGYLTQPARWREKPRSVARLRMHVLRLPYYGVAVTTFGWVPGSLIFPLVLHLKAGPLPAAVFGHFTISFLLSWLIAMAYSFILHQWIVMRIIYPRFWIGGTEIRKTAQNELGGVWTRFRLFYVLTGLIPIVAAGILIFVGPDKLDASSYRSFRILVTSLMGLGVLGVFFALSVSNQMSLILFALTGVSSRPPLPGRG